MTRLMYIAIASSLIAFTVCVITFVLTSSYFQYLLAVVNLIVLFNSIRIAVEMEM